VIGRREDVGIRGRQLGRGPQSGRESRPGGRRVDGRQGARAVRVGQVGQDLPRGLDAPASDVVDRPGRDGNGPLLRESEP
jgi:hypothetical protein